MKIRIDVAVDEIRRERVEQAMFERLDAIRGALEVPASHEQRDRVEHDLFDRLTAIRGLERAESIVPLRPRRRWVPYAALTAAAVIVLSVIGFAKLGRGGDRPRDPVISQHVVPPGGSTRWTSGDAVIEASGDTSVEERIDDDGVTLTLRRGKVDCDVEPIPGRAPFRVVAGTVTVTVVGTRFAVERTTTGVRVDVSRGKVRVTTPTTESYVTAGERWSNEPAITATATPPAPAPDAAGTDDLHEPADDALDDTIDPDKIDLEPRAPRTPSPTPKAMFERASKLERADLASAARLYRKIAARADRVYAPLALYALVEVERRSGHRAGALRAIASYLRRFPRGINVEDVMWLRVDIHRAAGQATAMRAAGSAYLQRFPSGTYADKIRRLLGTR